MNSKTRQYLFGMIFVAVGIYEATTQDYLEVALYFSAGTAFVINALSLEPKLHTYKKLLAILTWLLIASTGILFLYVLQFKF